MQCNYIYIHTLYVSSVIRQTKKLLLLPAKTNIFYQYRNKNSMQKRVMQIFEIVKYTSSQQAESDVCLAFDTLQPGELAISHCVVVVSAFSSSTICVWCWYCSSDNKDEESSLSVNESECHKNEQKKEEKEKMNGRKGNQFSYSFHSSWCSLSLSRMNAECSCRCQSRWWRAHKRCREKVISDRQRKGVQWECEKRENIFSIIFHRDEVECERVNLVFLLSATLPPLSIWFFFLIPYIIWLNKKESSQC